MTEKEAWLGIAKDVDQGMQSYLCCAVDDIDNSPLRGRMRNNLYMFEPSPSFGDVWWGGSNWNWADRLWGEPDTWEELEQQRTYACLFLAAMAETENMTKRQCAAFLRANR